MDRKERKEKFIEIAKTVQQAGKVYADFLRQSTGNDYLSEIQDLERQGDRLEVELNRYFTEQRNIPYLALDRAKLLRRLDEVLDQILISTLALDTFGSTLPSSFSSVAKDLTYLVEDLSTGLSDAVIIIYEDFKAAATLTKEIEEKRDRATQLIFGIEKQYFQAEETAENWKTFIAVSRIVNRTKNIVNAIKSAAEVIEIMSMKYI